MSSVFNDCLIVIRSTPVTTPTSWGHQLYPPPLLPITAPMQTGCPSLTHNPWLARTTFLLPWLANFGGTNSHMFVKANCRHAGTFTSLSSRHWLHWQHLRPHPWLSDSTSVVSNVVGEPTLMFTTVVNLPLTYFGHSVSRSNLQSWYYEARWIPCWLQLSKGCHKMMWPG